MNRRFAEPGNPAGVKIWGDFTDTLLERKSHQPHSKQDLGFLESPAEHKQSCTYSGYASSQPEYVLEGLHERLGFPLAHC